MQGRRKVLRGAVDAAYILQKTNSFGHGLRKGMVNLLTNSINLPADGASDISGNQVVDLVNAGECANGRGREVGIRVDQ